MGSQLAEPVGKPDQLIAENLSPRKPRTSFMDGTGPRRGPSPMDPVTRARLFRFSEPLDGSDEDRFDPHDPLQGSEAETFREYWAQRHKNQTARVNAQKARAVLKSKAHLDEFTKQLVDVDETGEEEEDACSDNMEIDKRTRSRLKEARLNALKNNQRIMEQKRR
ncbi:hypothetical protein B0I37DRAFT_431900 [Chaetomium sp. MPI-CAGE-AT-0009]|nr:hypothetical protein B0I37DRAFT_431900 [Chaetomium sp. MPI-CAGE-AT-0009]